MFGFIELLYYKPVNHFTIIFWHNIKVANTFLLDFLLLFLDYSIGPDNEYDIPSNFKSVVIPL